MDISARKILTNLAYYTLATLTVLFSVLFIVAINARAVQQWAMITYTIWAAVVILAVLFDVIASMLDRYKLVIGFAIYGLMVVFFAVGFIVFARLSVNGMIPAGSTEIFYTLIGFSLALTLGLIFTYVLGLRKLRLDRDNA